MKVATLPLSVDYAPMEARLVGSLPEGEDWRFEPKFDGFRCLAFRAGEDVDLRSKAGQPFNRYFPEMVEALRALPVERFVLDGELVVPLADALSFDDLLMRIHPAASRVQKLAQATPALYVAFDLLVDEGGQSLVDEPLTARRAALERFMKKAGRSRALTLAPQTERREEVTDWLRSLGSGLDGIMAKRAAEPYRSGERTAMQKWKRMRTADCVVGGFRYGSKERLVGSLLLGLYNDAGKLDHVGFSSNLRAAEKPALTAQLEALIEEPGFTGSRPGGPSRWSTERSTEWCPLRSELVAEVQYDHFSGGRFRHGTKILRWRPDKAPRQCTATQVEQESRAILGWLSPRA